jgi:hypothetical protein
MPPALVSQSSAELPGPELGLVSASLVSGCFDLSVVAGLGEDCLVDTNSIGPELGVVPDSPVGSREGLLVGTSSTRPELGLVSDLPVSDCSGLAEELGYPLFQPSDAPIAPRL